MMELYKKRVIKVVHLSEQPQMMFMMILDLSALNSGTTTSTRLIWLANDNSYQPLSEKTHREREGEGEREREGIERERERGIEREREWRGRERERERERGIRERQRDTDRQNKIIFGSNFRLVVVDHLNKQYVFVIYLYICVCKYIYD